MSQSLDEMLRLAGTYEVTATERGRLGYIVADRSLKKHFLPWDVSQGGGVMIVDVALRVKGKGPPLPSPGLQGTMVNCQP